MSTHQPTEMIPIDFFVWRASLAQSFNQCNLCSFIASDALGDVNRSLTVTLDISAFHPGSQTRHEKKRWRQDVHRPAFDSSQPINSTSSPSWRLKYLPQTANGNERAFNKITTVSIHASLFPDKKIIHYNSKKISGDIEHEIFHWKCTLQLWDWASDPGGFFCNY